VHYHLGKANVATHALRPKAHYNYLLTVRLTGEESIIRVLHNMSLHNTIITPLMREEIIEAQKNDEGIAHLRRRLLEGDPKVVCFREDAEGTLWLKDSLVVQKKKVLKKNILDEAHTSRYSIHPGSAKMNHDMR
jgi:hypothetical protein